MKLVVTRLMVAAAMICFTAVASLSIAGFNGGGGNRVGGVSIDAAGVVRGATVQENQELRNLLRNEVTVPEGDLSDAAELRMISLSGIQKAIVDVRASGARLPAEIRYLAGLTGIEYVLVDKDNNDLILAGPAEPWQLSETGSIVGTISGSAILRLEDLVVALRNVENSRREGISCSIEPTADGLKRLAAFQGKIRLRPGQNPQLFEEGMKQAFGPQVIRLTGVPSTSRFACTLVAADYQMKRLAMDLEESPIKQLPSYLQMSRNASHTGNLNPRWWMECSYEGLSRNQDATVWKLTGQGVKTLTEQDSIGDDGTTTSTAIRDKNAERWASKMTDSFEALAKEMPIFGDLQNLMDLSVVSTLIVQERLENRAGLDLVVLRDSGSLSPPEFDTPQTVSPECSFIKGRGGWVVAASGGVLINPFQVVHDQTVDPSLRMDASARTDRWYWDHQ
ncbi:MAG: DUF1598 domain-containing protein [Planctomycetota bacterium]